MKFTRCKANAPVEQKMAIIDKLSNQYSIHVLCEVLPFRVELINEEPFLFRVFQFQEQYTQQHPICNVIR